MSDSFSPGPQRIAETAARKGVTLDVRLMSAPALSSQEIGTEFGADLGQIVQSLVCLAPRPGNRLIPIVCLVPAGSSLDLDLVAAVTGEVAVSMATSRQAHELLGYPAATMPPFGHGREVRTVMDRDLGGYRWVWAAAGADSAILRVSPGTLRMLANAVVAPIATSARSPLEVPSGLRQLVPLAAGGIA